MERDLQNVRERLKQVSGDIDRLKVEIGREETLQEPSVEGVERKMVDSAGSDEDSLFDVLEYANNAEDWSIFELDRDDEEIEAILDKAGVFKMDR